MTAKRPGHQDWTPEADAALRGHWGTDTHPAVALALGRTVGAVKRRAAALGLCPYRPARRRWTAQELAALLSADAAGLKAHVIARRLGRSQSAVRCMLSYARGRKKKPAAGRAS